MKSTALLLALCLVAAAVLADQLDGDVPGKEQLHQEIALTATTNAPAGTIGTAMLEAETDEVDTSAGISLAVKGLAPGTYLVSVTRKSDGHAVSLGAFVVGWSGDDSGTATKSAGADEVAIEFGTSKGLPLPDGLAPMDIASLTISDTERRAVFTGSFLEANETMKAVFKAKVTVTGGEGAPAATGEALIHTRTRRGLKTERFKLNVKGVTPNATLALKINGEDFGTVTTDKDGKLRLNSLREGIEPESIILMEFADPDGTNALSISF